MIRPTIERELASGFSLGLLTTYYLGRVPSTTPEIQELFVFWRPSLFVGWFYRGAIVEPPNCKEKRGGPARVEHQDHAFAGFWGVGPKSLGPFRTFRRRGRGAPAAAGGRGWCCLGFRGAGAGENRATHGSPTMGCPVAVLNGKDSNPVF